MRSRELSERGEPAVTGDNPLPEEGPPVCPLCLDVRGLRVPMELRRPLGADFGFYECPACHLSFGDRRGATGEKPQP